MTNSTNVCEGLDTFKLGVSLSSWPASHSPPNRCSSIPRVCWVGVNWNILAARQNMRGCQNSNFSCKEKVGFAHVWSWPKFAAVIYETLTEREFYHLFLWRVKSHIFQLKLPYRVWRTFAKRKLNESFSRGVSHSKTISVANSDRTLQWWSARTWQSQFYCLTNKWPALSQRNGHVKVSLWYPYKSKVSSSCSKIVLTGMAAVATY